MNFRHAFTLSLLLVTLNPALSVSALPFIDKPAPKLIINGISGSLEKNVRAHLDGDFNSCKLKPSQLNSIEKSAEKKTRVALRALGYYSPTIVNTLKKTDKCWNLTLDIEKNTSIKIHELTLEIAGKGHNDKKLVAVKTNSKLKLGKRFRSDNYEQLKKQLIATAASRGYINAEFNTSKVAINTHTHTAIVTLRFNTGQRYRLGKFDIEAKPLVVKDESYPLTLSYSLIKKMIDLEENSKFVVSEVVSAQRKLNATGYFSQTAISLDTDNTSNGTIPVKITLAPALKHHYQFGVGYSTDLGPRLRFDYENKQLNSSGHQFRLNSSFSPIETNISTEYRWPSQNIPLNRYYATNFGFQKKETDTSESRIIKLGMSRTHILDNGWRWIMFTDALSEKFETGVDEDTIFLLTPGVSASKTHADNLSYTTRGYRLEGEILGASDSLGSDISMAQASINAKGIISLSPSTRFISRVQLGTTWVEDTERLPASFRFFTGGDSSVRGYRYEELGPEDSNGDVVGGKHLMAVSAEVDYRFSDQWGVALFADAGNAFNTTIDLRHSAGIGMRWFSPVGPVRIDIAAPINDDDADDIRLHLQLGPDL